MTDFPDIIDEIARQAAALLAAHTRPRVVRVGKAQGDALSRLGHTGDTLTVPGPDAPAPLIAHTGQTNAASRYDEITLLVERTQAPDELTVS
jgi:hypothetical protein